MTRLNQDIPADVFMHIAGREVMALRKKVAELSRENASLKENAVEPEQYERLLERERSYKAQIKSLVSETGLKKAQNTIRLLRRHNQSIAHRYIDGLNRGGAYSLRDLMELAYTAGFTADTYDFEGYYREAQEA